MIIHDLDGREYKIYNVEEFKNHIKQFQAYPPELAQSSKCAESRPGLDVQGPRG